MVKVKVADQEFYLDGYLKSNLDAIKKIMKKDWDFIAIVDGYEGVGKSVFAFQMAKYCDPTFNIDRIAFTGEDFIEKILKAEKYQVIVYDEAFSGLTSRQYYMELNNAIIKVLAEIRQKNLYIFICCPSFFDIEKYVALHRSRALFHVYTQENWERGSFRFYNHITKNDVWVKGKKIYKYLVRPDFYGSFTAYYTVDREEYIERKRIALSNRGRKIQQVGVFEEKRMKAFHNVLNYLHYDMEHTIQNLSDLTLLSKKTIEEDIRKSRLKKS